MHKGKEKEIKLFGLAFTIIFSFLTIKLYRSQNIFYIYTTIAASLFFVSSLFITRIILPIYKIFNFIGNLIFKFIANIILILIFYLVITPIGISLKIFHKDHLNLKRDKKESYWIHKKEERDLTRYTRQF